MTDQSSSTNGDGKDEPKPKPSVALPPPAGDGSTLENSRIIQGNSNTLVNTSVAASGSMNLKLQVPGIAVRFSLPVFGSRRSRKVGMLAQRVDSRRGEAVTSTMQALGVILEIADLYSYQKNASSTFWGRVHYSVGIPSATLAAVAGVLAENDTIPKWIVTACALASAALATLVTFLKSEKNKDHNRALSAEWSDLADRARLCLLDYSNSAKTLSKDQLLNLDSEYSRKIIALNSDKSRLLREELINSKSQSFESSSMSQT